MDKAQLKVGVEAIAELKSVQESVNKEKSLKESAIAAFKEYTDAMDGIVAVVNENLAVFAPWKAKVFRFGMESKDRNGSIAGSHPYCNGYKLIPNTRNIDKVRLDGIHLVTEEPLALSTGYESVMEIDYPITEAYRVIYNGPNEFNRYSESSHSSLFNTLVFTSAEFKANPDNLPNGKWRETTIKMIEDAKFKTLEDYDKFKVKIENTRQEAKALINAFNNIMKYLNDEYRGL